MLKHIYRLVACLCIFVVSIIIFSKNIHEEHYKQEITTFEQKETTFPIVSAKYGKHLINVMHGYLTNINLATIRDGIIPIDGKNKISFDVEINDTAISKIQYEVNDIKESKLVESGNVTQYKESKEIINAEISLNESYEDDTEYMLTIILVTDKADKIKYHSRIKRINTENLKEILDYSIKFHEDVLDKDTASNVVSYIEPDNTMKNTDLAYVNIHSSLNLISYGELAPKVITDVKPKIREVNAEGDTAIIELEFYVQSKTGSGVETYKVLEAFRLRWTSTRMYLLAYDRTMESVFDIDLVSISKNEFKLGITQDTDVECITTQDESKLAFVRNGELWYYNTAINEVVSVYSYMQENTDYSRDMYDKHDIKILDMDDFGNMDFLVYGYINAGEYEGRMGIILYKYYANDARIEEQLYIPVEVSFEVLKGYMTGSAYVNAHNVFFFQLGGSIFSYDMITDELTIIAENLSENNVVMAENGSLIAWMDSEKNDASIKMLNLETEEITQIQPEKGSCMRLLGAIDNTVIYGYSDIDEISVMPDGSTIVPINKVRIKGIDGELIKEYIPKNSYVDYAEVEDNKVKLILVNKNSDGFFVNAGEDYIFNSEVEKTNISTSYRLTDKTMTEWYLSVPSTTDINEKPNVSKAVLTELEDEKVIKMDFDSIDYGYYYVYSYHGMENQFNKAGEAIKLANEMMGVVCDIKGNKIWERGKAKDSASLNVEKVLMNDSIEACVRMLVNSAHGSVGDDVSFDVDKNDITEIVQKCIKETAVNVTGAELEDVLYYVSEGRPVIAMASSSKAVIITQYTGSHVVYIDPVNGEIKRTIKDAKNIFKKVGNIFITYTR